MSCNISIDKQTEKVALKYTRSDIIYHIANDAYIQRQAAKASVDVVDICADGNIDHVERVLRLTLRHIIEIMYTATKAEMSELPPAADGEGYELADYWIYPLVDDGYGSADKRPPTIIEDRTYTINMCVTNSSATTMEYLYDLIREVLICSVIADWLSIVAPDLSTIWQNKIVDAEDLIKSALNRRTKLARITPHWI